MKSLEDLMKIRDAAKNNMAMRSDDKQKYRVVVGMATCGIAAGARPVLNTLVEEVANQTASYCITDWLYRNVYTRTNRRSV